MKKSKLFLSIVSLCFSLAVLTFGVFAANQVNYTLSGNISYVVSDAYIDMHTAVYTFDGDMPTTRNDLKALADLFPDGTAYTSFASIASSNDLTSVATSAYNSLSGDSTGITEIANGIKLTSDLALSLNTTTHKAYVIVVNIKNLGDNDIYARLDNENTKFYAKVGNEYSSTAMTTDAVVGSNLMRYQTGGKQVIEKNDIVNMVYVFGIEDITLQIPDMKFDYKFEIKNGAYHPNNTVLHYDTTGHYYYVEMGPYSESAIKWRLVSVDGGLTKYTAPEYDAAGFEAASLPTGDCVFIQETNTMTNSVGTINNSDIYINSISFQNSCYFKGIGGGTPSTEEEYQQVYVYDWSANSGAGDFVYATDGSKIKANDYSMSTIRQYLKGNDVYKNVDYNGQITEAWYNSHPYTNYSMSNIFSDYNIDAEEDVIYTKIISRTLTDMYKHIDAVWGDDGIEFSNVSVPKHANTTGANRLDKLWLISAEDVEILFWETIDEELVQSGAEWYGDSWWTRSGDVGYSCYAWATSGGADGDFTASSYNVRPSFLLDL